jgi:hypothetical protein
MCHTMYYSSILNCHSNIAFRSEITLPSSNFILNDQINFTFQCLLPIVYTKFSSMIFYFIMVFWHLHRVQILLYRCSFKFLLKVGFEESIVKCERTTDYRSRISCLNLTSLFALFVFLLCRLTRSAFTIDSSTPTLRRNLNEHPI